MLATCLWSLREQVGTPPFYVLPVDGTGMGAAWARQQGIDQAVTPWIGFLDSDDWAYPDHVATLYRAALESGADYVYSYFTIHDMWEGARPDLDPLRTFGQPFDRDRPVQTTGTILVRRDALQRHGLRYEAQPEGRMIPGTDLRYGEDYDLMLRSLAAGLTIRHVPRRTWAWRVGHHNTSGLPGRGDAAST